MPKFNPMLLELGEAGEDGERLVFYKYQSRIQRFFEKKGISPAEAQDLTQETFLRVFRSEARLENREQMEAWIFEIARNVRVNALRAKGTLKRAATVISLDEPGIEGEPREVTNPALSTDEQDALANAITREQLRALQNALAELPEQMRHCVRLRLQDDLKYKEIAKIMRISIETVKSHLHQAKKRLRSLLEPHFGPIDF
ncbi:MAG TPA: sigma-70 family RNA polymerase sigma factor [Thermoanaerobaculia bacterium]|jgi:RNA polymerase sigma-70 factor (ECF subfamily)|nr:sigma-70 family RNA polymerase sigma factor [Thermoanaerobaculia bacterium]